jgi:hypothetical protein
MFSHGDIFEGGRSKRTNVGWTARSTVSKVVLHPSTIASALKQYGEEENGK